MKPNSVRVLCVDSMDGRRRQLVSAMEQIGLEVWTARNVADAQVLIDGLRPSAIVIDQESTLAHARDWSRLTETSPSLPVLLHSASCSVTPASRDEMPAVRTGDPEILVAILSILLGADGRKGPMGRVA